MTTEISCSIGTTDPSAQLGLEIWIDDKKLVDVSHVTAEFEFKYDFTEDDNNHELRVLMKNKTHEHTKLNEDGNITTDARLTVSNLAFDGIALEQLFLEKAAYTHDFNGTKSEIKDKFYGEMGCNGVVSLQFTSPIYLWLLENM